METQKWDAAQMHFLRPLLGFTRLHHQENSDIRDRMNATDIAGKIQAHQKKWRNHLERIWRDCLLQLASLTNSGDY
jgi:hypothetical protein